VLKRIQAESNRQTDRETDRPASSGVTSRTLREQTPSRLIFISWRLEGRSSRSLWYQWIYININISNWWTSCSALQRSHCLGFFPRSWEFGGRLGIWGFWRAILGFYCREWNKIL